MLASTLLKATPTYWTNLLDNTSLPLQAIVFGSLITAIYFAYSLVTAERPLKGFPIVSLGSGPGSSWSAAGNDIVAKGLKEHNGLFQVITGTGPKVGDLKCLYLHRSRCRH